MSDSYRTQKESIVAARRIRRDRQGAPVYPKIIVRRPTPGDIHPLSKPALSRLFTQIPVEYLYGLNRIELKPRLNKQIGAPFAQYLRYEKKIELFSLPTEWDLEGLGSSLRASLSMYYAEIEDEEGKVTVTWKDDALMTLWYYCDVFAHELGHHFRGQYRHKNGTWGRRSHEEWVADLHAKRFRDALFRKHRQRSQTV